MTRLTKKQVFLRLVEIGKMKDGSGWESPWIGADSIDQEAFFALQQAFSDLLAELSNEVGGAEVLAAALPHAFDFEEVSK